MAIQRQQPATKAQQYLLKQQQNRFCNYTSNNSSYIPMNENKEEKSANIEKITCRIIIGKKY